MIMEQDTEHQAPLLASTMASLGDEYLQRCGLLELSRQSTKTLISKSADQEDIGTLSEVMA